ncbi:hypothetical protein PENTCL1PPCAC_8856, partial [Pristionchus entomophagus]
CSSLGVKRQEWKEELMKLNKAATEYSIMVRRELRKEDISYQRLEELENYCEKLREAIMNLPDMQVESLFNINDQAMVKFAEDRGVMKSIAAAEKMESIEDVTGEEVTEHTRRRGSQSDTPTDNVIMEIPNTRHDFRRSGTDDRNT